MATNDAFNHNVTVEICCRGFISTNLPMFFFFLQVPEGEIVSVGSAEDTRHYEVCRMCVEELALYLKPISGGKGESVKRMIQVDHHSDVKNHACECCIIV